MCSLRGSPWRLGLTCPGTDLHRHQCVDAPVASIRTRGRVDKSGRLGFVSNQPKARPRTRLVGYRQSPVTQADVSQTNQTGRSAHLEDLTPTTRVRGVLPDRAVTVVQVEWHGTQALTLTYRDDAGKVDHELLYRANEARLEIEEVGRAWSFDADGQLFRLASEALRIRLAHLFDPYLAVHTSNLDPLPHQIRAVYGEMLPRQPLRFLLADDPGAGKTIMAGLLIKELIVRGDLKRCLIVPPGSLVEQWQDELALKLGLEFEIITRDAIEASRSGNPFAEKSLVIARLDQPRTLQTRLCTCARDESRRANFVDQYGDAARAAATASSREWTPSAWKRRRMWFRTVSVLRWSSAAICFVERPCSRRWSTSTWRGVRCGCGAVGLSSGCPSNSPKTPTTRSPLISGTELISTATRVPALETKTPVASVAGLAEYLPGEQLAGAQVVLGRDDGGEVATANVADKLLGCRIDPPDDSPCVEDVARDADAFQSLLDVAAECQASGHHGSVADPRARVSSLSSRPGGRPARDTAMILARSLSAQREAPGVERGEGHARARGAAGRHSKRARGERQTPPGPDHAPGGGRHPFRQARANRRARRGSARR